MTSKFYRIPMLLAAVASTSTAWAGADTGPFLRYGPVANVPTISGTMLIVLAMILAVIGYRMLKNRSGGGNIAAALIGTVALASSVGGIKLINNAEADMADNYIDMNNKFGGILDLQAYVNNVATNKTSRPQVVLEVYLPDGCYPDKWESYNPTCKVGLTVQPYDSCEVNCIDGKMGNGGVY